MSAGATIVWCVALLCSTVVICVVSIALAFKASEEHDKKNDSHQDEKDGIWVKTE